MSNQQWGPPPGQYSGPPGPPGPPPYGGPPQYAAPQYQQNFGWGQLPPPPKKKRGVAVVLGILGGLVVLGVVGFAVAAAVAKNDEPTVTHPATVPTAGPTSEDPGPFPTTTASIPTGPATTRQPVPTKTTPPPKPQPTANQIVTANRLYKTGLQRAVSCKESKVGLSTNAKADAYYVSLKKCLDRAWPRQIVAAGYKFRAPGLISWVGAANSPCGNSDRSLSFYCPTNHTVYMDVSDDVGYWRQDQYFGRALASHTVAHEYSHAMQSLVGILSANYELQYNGGSQAKKLELNRRMELQASCLGNTFLGTNKGSYGIKGQLYSQWLHIVNGSGDENARGGPRDHGTRASHGYWARRGFAARNPASCNTFVAPSNKVS